ncbi:hypothetical protein V6N12_002208 [Hibiscus sabdariffa]|uniref:Reverse transcriptase domain-containing protein n=1 Tax=Hibiscus sabdariffa TaxID=183260 RepID=A0ABR2BI06_9ROSI
MWKSFHFIRHGFSLSHMFFADYLILYAKADMNQALNIQDILNVFGVSLGHHLTLLPKKACLDIEKAHLAIYMGLELYDLQTFFANLLIMLLRQKYKLNGLLLMSIHRTSCTPLWRALSKYWDVLRHGLLQYHLKSETLLFPIGSFSNLLDDTGNWDRDKLCAIFHPEVVPYSLGVKCPDSSDNADQIIWRRTTKSVGEHASPVHLTRWRSSVSGSSS